MRALKYFVCLWAAVAAYALAAMVFGNMGVLAYADLVAKRDAQMANIALLEADQAALERAKEALLYDKDRLSVYARELGFGAGNERFIRVQGLSSPMRPEFQVGSVYRPTETPRVADTTLRLLACGLGLALLLSVAALDIFRAIRSD